MTKFSIFRSAIFAGICIALAGFGFLAGKSLGIILFVFGLAAVVNYQLKLFTGTAGFVKSWSDMLDLCIILVGNWAGCMLIALMARCSPMPLQETAQQILEARMATGALKAGALSIGCGILMSAAVTFARKSKEFGHWLPLVFAVPLFIHCGFPHSIADAFYYLTAPWAFWQAHFCSILAVYFAIVAGNFIGCNVYRAFCKI